MGVHTVCSTLGAACAGVSCFPGVWGVDTNAYMICKTI